MADSSATQSPAPTVTSSLISNGSTLVQTPPAIELLCSADDEAALYPSDSYSGKTYWADLDPPTRRKWIAETSRAEIKSEFWSTWRLFKASPLAPLRWYWRDAILPGFGIGLEGYVLFSVSNLKGMFKEIWPTCWKTYETCDRTVINSIEWILILMIIVGQLSVGFIGDKYGRRTGLILDAWIMLIAFCVLAGAWGSNLNGWVMAFVVGIALFGFVTGGEYPMTAASTMETTGERTRAVGRQDRLHRGRKTTQAFLMQGWGQFINVIVLILLFLVSNHGSGSPYLESAAQVTYRLSFAFPAGGAVLLIYHRMFRLRGTSAAARGGKAGSVTGYNWAAIKLAIGNFGGRLFATGLTWFLHDINYYGTKLFTAEFLAIVIGAGSLSFFSTWYWNLLTIAVAILGFYTASLTIDHKRFGRKRMQTLGFSMTCLCYIASAIWFDWFEQPGLPSGLFFAIHILAGFFSQLGANSTTFLCAGESYPGAVRASFHGISAALGKCGALVASVTVSRTSDRMKFAFMAPVAAVGLLVTLIFLPDTTGMDLSELERWWNAMLTGDNSTYHGVAIHPRHLSKWENWRGVAKNYNPELDARDRRTAVASEKAGGTGAEV